MNRAKSAVILKAPIQKREKVAELGPGYYELPEKEIKSHTFAREQKVKDPYKSIGPGEYEIDESPVRPRSKKAFISSSPKKLNKSHSTLGPGAYYLHEKEGKGFTIGTRKTSEVQPTLGPGEY